MRDLFDFGFKRFITPSLVKLLFVIWVGLQLVTTLGLWVWLIPELIEQKETREGVNPIMLALLVSSPVALAVSILVGRVVAELVLVAFKIEEELRLIRTR